MAREIDLLTVARADALFASDLSASRRHTQAEVAAAIRHAIRAHGGSHGCAGEVAAAYGEYGELAAQRMRWALGVVKAFYSSSSAGPSAVGAAVTTARPAARNAPRAAARGELPRPNDRPPGRAPQQSRSVLRADRAEGTNDIARSNVRNP